MRKIIILAVALLISLINLNAEETRLAVIDIEKIFTAFTYENNVRNELRKQINDAKESIEKKLADIQKVRRKIEEGTLSADRIRALRLDLALLENDLSRLVKIQENLIRQREDEITKEILRDIQEAAAQVADDKDFNIVIERREATVIYSIAKFDITKDVIDYMKRVRKERSRR